jgi:hypothetical protein
VKRRAFAYRHDSIIIGICVLVALAGALGYQVWAGDRDGHTQGRITKAASTCDQVDRLYSAVVQLMVGDSTFTPEQIRAMVNQRRDRLGSQGCD